MTALVRMKSPQNGRVCIGAVLFLFSETLSLTAPDWSGREIGLFSWCPLVPVRKVERISAVNERAGLPQIRIHTPEEGLDL